MFVKGADVESGKTGFNFLTFGSSPSGTAEVIGTTNIPPSNPLNILSGMTGMDKYIPSILSEAKPPKIEVSTQPPEEIQRLFIFGIILFLAVTIYLVNQGAY